MDLDRFYSSRISGELQGTGFTINYTESSYAMVITSDDNQVTFDISPRESKTLLEKYKISLYGALVYKHVLKYKRGIGVINVRISYQGLPFACHELDLKINTSLAEKYRHASNGVQLKYKVHSDDMALPLEGMTFTVGGATIYLKDLRKLPISGEDSLESLCLSLMDRIKKVEDFRNTDPRKLGYLNRKLLLVQNAISVKEAKEEKYRKEEEDMSFLKKIKNLLS